MCAPNDNKATSSAVSNAKDDKELQEKGNEWIEKFDYDGFYKEIRALGKKLEAAQGPADVAHLNKMIMWSNSCAAFGLLTMGFGINPFSIIGLSLYTFSRWTMIAHHTCHGGYDKCHPDRKGRWSRFKFALSTFWRRFNDWFDWMMPEAWNVEHNTRHHYNLSEVNDPDLVERNMENIRALPIPMVFKYGIVAVLMLTWKWVYYAPNTYKELKLAQMLREGKKIPKDADAPIMINDVLTGGASQFYTIFEYMTVVMGPYLLIHFFLTPLPFYLLGDQLTDFGYSGSSMYTNAVKNLFLAEILTNIHSFIAIVTNHAGDDMYRFRHGCRPYSCSFFLRQVLASADFSMGTDLIDFMHGWLNYQIEHHLWPNLSMLSYQNSAPLVQEICERYGVPYVKQNVFWRLKKTVDIMIGAADMRWFPESYEKKFLEKDASMEADKRK
jgi:fatty acid desaturase